MGYFRFKPEHFFLKVPKGLLSSHNVKILHIWDGTKKDWTKARPKPSCTTIKSHSSMSRLRNTRCHRQSSKWSGYSHASGTATWSRYGCSLGLALFGAYSLGLILTVSHPVSFQRNSDHITHCLDCEGFSWNLGASLQDSITLIFCMPAKRAPCGWPQVLPAWKIAKPFWPWLPWPLSPCMAELGK